MLRTKRWILMKDNLVENMFNICKTSKSVRHEGPNWKPLLL